MADEVLIAKFEADLAGVKKQLDDYIASLEKVQKEEKDTQKETAKTAGVAESAAKKRSTALKTELAELNRLRAAAKQAFTPEAIETFNKKILESKNRIALLRNETQNFGAGIKSSLAGIGAGIAAAFSVSSVIAFGKASINAFLEAEESANKLRFAIVGINGETEVAFNKLLSQSAKLRDAFKLFSDEDIQGAQAQLATFGLFSNQIEKLIPRILEFATAQRVDVKTATDIFLRSLEGQTRGLVTAGLKFKDTGTIMGNYNVILESTAKLTGATAEASATLVGELKAEEIAANELQETLGEKLAPTFVHLKTAIFEAVLGLLGFNKAVEEIKKNRSEAIANDFEVAAERIRKAGGSVEDVFSKRLESLEKSTKDAAAKLEEARKRLESANLNKEPGIPNNNITDPLRRQIELNEQIIEQNNIKRQKILEILDAQRLEKQNQEAILTAEELRLKTLIELNNLLLDNQSKQDVISKDNVSRIEKELEARKKAADQAKKQQDVRIAGSEEEIEKIKRLLAQYNDLLKLLKNPNQQLLIELSVLAEVDPEAFKQKIAELVAKQDQELTIPVTLEPRIDEAVFQDGLNHVKQSIAELVQEWLEANQKILNTTQETVGKIQQITSQFTENRLAEIAIERQAQEDSYNQQYAVLNENINKRRVSETEAQKLTEELNAKRLADSKRLADKERALKRKQFEIDKAAALIEIAINTAVAVSENLGIPVLAAAIAILGAAEAAAVASKPNPYKKGTKSAKPGLALVDEDGREAVYKGRLTTLERGDKVVPFKQTKKHEKIIDAMVDDRLEQYIFKTYITPHLVAQKKEQQYEQHKTFSRALSDSLIVNVAAPAMRKQDRFAMTNVEELAAAIARNTQRDIYR